MLLKHIYLLSAFLLFSACEKEIKIIKKPKSSPSATASSGAQQQYAIFYSQSMPTDIVFRGLRDSTNQYYSLSLDGREQEITYEDGTPVVGVRFENYMPTKKGILVSIRNEGDKIYLLENGKVLKLINDNLLMRVNYRQAAKGYQVVDQNMQYFCSSNSLMAWRNDSSSLVTVKENVNNCSGNQVKDHFYLTETINRCDEEEECIDSFVMSRIHHQGGSFQIQELEERELANGEYYNADQFIDFGDYVAYKFYSQANPITGESMGLRRISKESGEIETLLSKIENPGEYSYINVLNDGQLFNGKIIYQLVTDKPAELMAVYADDEERIVFSTNRAQDVIFGEVTPDRVRLLTMIADSRISDYNMVTSGDRLLILKHRYRYYYENPDDLYYRSYNESSLLNMNLDATLVHMFENANKNKSRNIHLIKGINYISETTERSLEDGGNLTTLFILPTTTESLRTDPRFVDQSYNRLNFLNFYDKVLFETEVVTDGDRNSVVGFFGEDGIIQLVDKIRAAIGFFDT